ncbi:Flp pilus assembly complex ATPase component TadA, partial [Planktothrix sp. FACHB-1355]
MRTSLNLSSPWQRLKTGEITSDKALKLLVDEAGIVNLDLLDLELTSRFFRQVANRHNSLPVIPLLLWRNCYYLGSPIALADEDINQLCDRTLTDIKIIPIADKSYRAWHLTQTFDANSISASSPINPITGQAETEDISEVTELYLSKADDQISRIKTLISGALRYRASDIHLEPTPDGLRVRYRIDGILRDITILPLDISRRVVVALKIMSNMDIAESRRPQDGRIGESYKLGSETELGLDMRVSTLPCIGGEKAVIRL